MHYGVYIVRAFHVLSLLVLGARQLLPTKSLSLEYCALVASKASALSLCVWGGCRGYWLVWRTLGFWRVTYKCVHLCCVCVICLCMNNSLCACVRESEYVCVWEYEGQRSGIFIESLHHFSPPHTDMSSFFHRCREPKLRSSFFCGNHFSHCSFSPSPHVCLWKPAATSAEHTDCC